MALAGLQVLRQACTHQNLMTVMCQPRPACAHGCGNAIVKRCMSAVDARVIGPTVQLSYPTYLWQSSARRCTARHRRSRLQDVSMGVVHLSQQRHRRILQRLGFHRHRGGELVFQEGTTLHRLSDQLLLDQPISLRFVLRTASLMRQQTFRRLRSKVRRLRHVAADWRSAVLAVKNRKAARDLPLTTARRRDTILSYMTNIKRTRHHHSHHHPHEETSPDTSQRSLL